MDNGPVRILLVDDDEDDYILTRSLLSEIDNERFRLDWLDNYEAAERAIERGEHELYLLDYNLGEHDGLELLRKALERGCEAPVILVTGHEDRETDLRAMKAGAADYLVKGQIDARILERSIRYALEQKRAEEDLHKAKKAAENACRAKTQFLANMSHEIRTPMSCVLGIMDLLQETELSAHQREYLEMARTSARSLLSLLNDILDLSKIEAARLELNPIVFSIRQCVEDVVGMLAVQAREKRLDLSAHVDPEVPPVLVGDPIRLRQIILNLVGNAIKFTNSGGVSVEVELRAWDSSEVILGVLVRDTGIGIAEDKQELIFDAFRQADGSTTRRYGGTGLGLTISARLVELMGGSIRVQSRAGEGSVFHFTARLSPASVEAAEMAGEVSNMSAAVSPLQPAASPLRILLAEDNVINQRLATGLLTKKGHEVTVVENGLEAVVMAGREQFDLVLMDVQMPEMDGLEATAAIRQIEENSGRRTPIIALTAHAMRGDMERCVQAGMDDYLTKPIDLNRLSAILRKWTPAEPVSPTV
jgi:signal transduction histidine kinase